MKILTNDEGLFLVENAYLAPVKFREVSFTALLLILSLLSGDGDREWAILYFEPMDLRDGV